jgi:hypothetical protein
MRSRRVEWVGIVALVSLLLSSGSSVPDPPPERPPEITTRTLVSSPDRIEISFQLPAPRLKTARAHALDQTIEIPGAISNVEPAGSFVETKKLLLLK